MIRLGLVRYLNARPLDFAFQVDSPFSANVVCQPDTPARLIEQLLAGKLDAALVSSVECLRNRSTLNYCSSVGVASDNAVQSLLYLRRIEDDLKAPVKRLYLDTGSRTTVALVKLLYLQDFGKLPECISLDPHLIADKIDSDSAGLIIGDTALSFFYEPRGFHFYDLVSWWRSRTGLPFVAALWAYPKEKSSLFEAAKPNQGLFEQALDYGLQHIEDILKEYGEVYRPYLTKALHHRLTDADQKALTEFESLLRAKDLL